ncbi:adenylate/guanylate cyclase domain-containing protein [Ruegeria sp. 2205SS24-7]|uniref:adenylate/guanylate cyclase domain-containing protein n=1 Tax=Ruegeria discodermiae TaxID=3064389 RepID=UPI002740A9F8|nr:adenylate/guanylate cyclase domain-containing protein [Ruegeria sp. 2205SS24-7]MDP5220822.1 adenylate/guanylate cyclase domain-containing protein [Ruegeria sp. 2205SS24-7]
MGIAVSILVAVSIGVSTFVVHSLWWTTARDNSRMLAAEINSQIANTVRIEVGVTLRSAEAAWAAVRTIFVQNVIATRQADKREFVFLSQLQAQPNISWIFFGWPDGNFFASHRLGDGGLEMIEIDREIQNRLLRKDRYIFIPGDIQFEERTFTETSYDPREHAWFKNFMGLNSTGWIEALDLPDSDKTVYAFAGPIDVNRKRQGVLAVAIETDRLSRFLATLAPGEFGAAFILNADGKVIAVPDADADEITPARMGEGKLYEVAMISGERLLADPEDNAPGSLTQRIVIDGVPYAVALTPLGFYGWRVATVIPEAAFLSGIDETLINLIYVLIVVVVVATGLAIWLIRRIVANPLARIAEDLGKIERFDVERIARRPSRLSELANLSAATASMAAGLSAFRKYVPTDLVRMLVAEGIKIQPGGDMRQVSVLFCDVTGFTGLSEKLGPRIVQLMEPFFSAASAAISHNGGTIDKFIGDAVMAFWGAPRKDIKHAENACRAALDLLAAVEASGIQDDAGNPLRVRIGLNSGEALVGNIGSEQRLNYTAIGDVVNVASRLEGANKDYGTLILIGPETRRQAADTIVVRELDTLTVFGRIEELVVYELIAMADEFDGSRAWIETYEQGLAHYRAGRFEEAIGAFETADRARNGDPASVAMMSRAQVLLDRPPAEDWRAVRSTNKKR